MKGYNELEFAEQIFELPVMSKEVLEEFGPLCKTLDLCLLTKLVPEALQETNHSKMIILLFRKSGLSSLTLRRQGVDINTRRLSLRGVDRSNRSWDITPLQGTITITISYF